MELNIYVIISLTLMDMNWVNLKRVNTFIGWLTKVCYFKEHKIEQFECTNYPGTHEQIMGRIAFRIPLRSLFVSRNFSSFVMFHALLHINRGTGWSYNLLVEKPSHYPLHRPRLLSFCSSTVVEKRN